MARSAGEAATSPYIAFEEILKRYHASAGPSQLDGPLSPDAVLDEEHGMLVQLQASLEKYLVSMRAHGRAATESEEYKWLLLEHRTWGLIRAVYENRISREGGVEGPSAEQQLAQNPYTPPMDLTQTIVNENGDLSLWATLIEHLQTRPLFSSPPPLEARHGYIPTTVRRAKTAKLTSTGTNAVSLDPDFTLRDPHGQALAGEDQTYQTPLMETLWDLVRHGELDQAMRVCEEGGEPWRAASMMGGRRWNMGGMTQESQKFTPLTGNRSRALWKTSCRAIAKNPTLSSAEREVYAALVTDLPTLLPACDTWEDQVWAHVSHRLEARIDRRWHDLGSFWEQEDALLGGDDEEAIELGRGGLEEVFASISASKSGALAEASRNPLYITQKQVLLDRTNAHLDTFADRIPHLGQAVSDELVGPLLRFFTHLVLVLRTLSQAVPESAANIIIEAYLRVLERDGNDSLVAPYAACLREGNGEESYARFLRSMDPNASREDKRAALLRAKDYGLNVATIATETVRMILHAAFESAPSLKPGQPDITEVRVQVSEHDWYLIRALEWLTMVPETLPEALVRANDVMRYFLALGQANSAGALMQTLPEDIDDAEEEDEEDSQATEFADYHKLFDVFQCHDAIDEVALAEPKETASKAEQFNWSKKLLAAIMQTHAQTQDILTSGWLKFPTNKTAYDSQRRRELERIRQIFVPDLVFRIHDRLMSNAHRFPHLVQEALNLANIVAAQEFGVYEEFIGRDADVSRLTNYLDHLRQASMAALAGGSHDPFRVRAER